MISAMRSPISSNVVPLVSKQAFKPSPVISFHRQELDILLQLYSSRVGSGEWRDYAIDMLKERAVFSVFKRASEVPIYTIEKTPKLARKQGEWSVINANGLVLKRGRDLRTVLRVLHKKPKLILP